MKIKNKIKHFLGRFPFLFYPIYRLVSSNRDINEVMLNKDSELVIEGFPRTANTYAVVAFRHAQGRDVPMAHHLHVEAQILKGVALGLPAIVLIRKPIDAVKSLLIRHPLISAEYAFNRYINFYTAVKKVADRIIIAEFEQVTFDFGNVILRVNQKFGTNYKIFNNNPENVKAIFREIENINNNLDGGSEMHVARPSKERKKQHIVIPDKPFVREAEKLYQDITSL